jgi:aspartate-semialdehyde dehydrogenase
MLLGHPVLFKSLCYVDGRWVHSASATSVAVLNPADQRILGHVPMLDASQITEAVDAAQRAFSTWRWLPVAKRSALLLRWHELILRHQHDLAAILSLEQGKPLAEARGEIAYGASFVEWFAHEVRRLNGRTIPTHIDGAQLGTVIEPVGVAALITPWNFPCAMITRKAAAALAAGCTVVVKPAHETPFSALALAQLAEEAGFPAGVFNVVLGEPHMAMETLVSDTRVRSVSFTGSTRVGSLVMQTAAKAGIKKTALELGGNAPFIVFDDADLDSAVEGALASKYRNAGQTCVCANRLYVQEGVYDAFVEKLAARVKTMKVGNGFEDGVVQGPLIEPAAIEKVQRHVADALAKGAKIVVGGHKLQGQFFEPTVIANATSDMLCAREETFGPVAPVFRFRTEQEAVDAANHTEFGLASYFYSRDIGRITRVSEALEYGMVGINTGLISTEHVPFGGVKQSGLGREGSTHGIDEYVEMKYLCIGDVLR